MDTMQSRNSAREPFNLAEFAKKAREEVYEAERKWQASKKTQ